MLNFTNYEQEATSNVVLRTSDNEEIRISELTFEALTYELPPQLLSENYAQQLNTEEEVKVLLIPHIITRLEMLKNNGTDDYNIILSNLSQNISRTPFLQVKSLNNLDIKNNVEESKYLTIDANEYYTTNINKLEIAMFHLISQRVGIAHDLEHSAYIPIIKKLYRSDTIFKLSLDLNVLRMVVTGVAGHLANIETSMNCNLQNRNTVNVQHIRNHVDGNIATHTNNNGQQNNIDVPGMVIAEIEEPQADLGTEANLNPLNGTNVVAPHTCNVVINNINNGINNVLPVNRLNVPMVIAEPVVNIPTAVNLNVCNEVILANNGNIQRDALQFGLLLNSDNLLIPDIDNIDLKQYCSLMGILKSQIQKRDFIQKEKTKFNDEPAYRTKAVDAIITASTNGPIRRKKQVEEAIANTTIAPTLNYEHDEIEVNQIYITNISSFSNSFRDSGFVADLLYTLRVTAVELSNATRMHIVDAINVLNVDMAKDGTVRSRTIKLPILPFITTNRFHYIKCAERPVSSHTTIIDQKATITKETLKTSTVQSVVAVTLTNAPIENSRVVAVASAVTEMELNHVATKLELQLHSLGIDGASVLAYPIWCPFMDKATPPNKVNMHVLSLVILVPHDVPTARINEIKEILHMTNPRSSFITIGSTVLHLKHSVSEMFHVGLPREVRTNPKCLVISNMKYISPIELVEGIAMIIPVTAIQNIYYFQRASEHPVTYHIVLFPDTYQPCTISTLLLDQHCYIGNGRVVAEFGHVKPITGNDTTIKSKNIFAIDPINLTSPNTKMSPSLRGPGVPKRK